MAKAQLQLADGTTVNIEGSVDEVAKLLERISRTDGATRLKIAKPAKGEKRSTSASVKRKKKAGPTVLIGELADEGYFKSRRTIADIRAILEERGHIYSLQDISPILTRLTRRRSLRRLREKKGWVYVV